MAGTSLTCYQYHCPAISQRKNSGNPRQAPMHLGTHNRLCNGCGQSELAKGKMRQLETWLDVDTGPFRLERKLQQPAEPMDPIKSY